MINTYSDKKLILMFYSTYLYCTNIKISCVNINNEEDKLDFVIKLTPDILYYIDKETYYFLNKEYKITDHKLLVRSNSKLSLKDFKDANIFKLNHTSYNLPNYNLFNYNLHNSNNYYYNYQSTINLYHYSNAQGPTSYYLHGDNLLYGTYALDTLKNLGVFIPNVYSEELRKRKIFPYQLTSKQNCKPIELNNN